MEGIGGAVAVSSQMGPQGEALLDAARSAFVDGWATSMWLSAGLALDIAAFVFALMPTRDDEALTEVLDAEVPDDASELVGPLVD